MIPVDCAVNDDHGNLDNRVVSIHFQGLELEAVDMRGPTFRQLQGAIKVSRRAFPARHVRSHVGNIYWEGYELTPEVAVDLMHYCRGSKWFTCDAGYVELAEYFDSSIEDRDYARRLLVDAAKDYRL